MTEDIETSFFEPFWKPGGVVKLKQPHKPNVMLVQLRRHIADAVIASKQRGLDRPPFYAKEELLVLQRQHAYREEWQGFTHGIIVGEVSREDDQVTSVSLILYDPSLSILYCDLPTGNPTYVDLSVDELIPLRAHQPGDEPISE